MNEVGYYDYSQATKFARWKYKYGLFVLIGCWVCLILLCYFVYTYATELSTHPALYTIDKLGVDYCYCYGEGERYYINSTSIEFSKELFGIPNN